MGEFSRYKPRKSRKVWLEGAPDAVVAVYDNGGKTADRYTVLYGAPHWSEDYAAYYWRIGQSPRMTPARFMSENPFHPQGVGMYGDCERGPHLGKKIRYSDLPDKCKQCVEQDCQEDSN